MAIGKTPIPVPKFTALEIKVAELCAEALWRGIDFRTDAESETSDEILLNNFYVSFRRLARHPSLPSLITEAELKQLIRITEMKAMYRSTLKLDFPLGIKSITNQVAPIYNASIGRSPNDSRLNYGIKSVMGLSLCWVNNPKPSINGNYRVPFSTRLLFFCAPEMMIFNFSNELARKMQLQTRPQAALRQFNELLERGLHINRVLLNGLQLPERSALNKTNWNRISKTDWWQRRVLDIALLIRFQISIPHINFSRKARSLIRAARQTP
jgi:hypothetical protein